MKTEFDIPLEPNELLEEGQVSLLVQEAALDFFEEHQLPAIVGLSEEAISSLRKDPNIEARIRKLAVQLRESGEGFKKAAARFAETLLPDVAYIISDPDAKPMEKLKAAEMIASWAGYGQKNTPAVNVEINLANVLNDAEERKSRVLTLDRTYLHD